MIVVILFDVYLFYVKPEKKAPKVETPSPKKRGGKDPVFFK